MCKITFETPKDAILTIRGQTQKETITNVISCENVGDILEIRTFDCNLVTYLKDDVENIEWRS